MITVIRRSWWCESCRIEQKPWVRKFEVRSDQGGYFVRCERCEYNAQRSNA